MTLPRWLFLIGMLVVLGFARVAQQNATIAQAYVVSAHAQQLHREQTEVDWLQARVIGLSSPGRLAETAKARGMEFVAWSTLPSLPALTAPGVEVMAQAPASTSVPSTIETPSAPVHVALDTPSPAD